MYDFKNKRPDQAGDRQLPFGRGYIFSFGKDFDIELDCLPFGKGNDGV